MIIEYKRSWGREFVVKGYTWNPRTLIHHNHWWFHKITPQKDLARHTIVKNTLSFIQGLNLDLVSAVTYYKVSATSPKHKYIPFNEKCFIKNEFHSQLSWTSNDFDIICKILVHSIITMFHCSFNYVMLIT